MTEIEALKGGANFVCVALEGTLCYEARRVQIAWIAAVMSAADAVAEAQP